MKIIMTIFTSPPELASHHRPSTLKPVSESGFKNERWSIDFFNSGKRGFLNAESRSLEELGTEYLEPPMGTNKLWSGMPILMSAE